MNTASLTAHRPASPPARQPTPWPASAPGPVRRAAAEDASTTWADWLARPAQRDALFRCALQCCDDEAERRALAASAVDVQRQGGLAALDDWLFWATLMLARRRAEDPCEPWPVDAHQAPELALLLWLAVCGRLRTPALLALRQQPLARARATLLGWTAQGAAARAAAH